MLVADQAFWLSIAALPVALASLAVSGLTLYLARRRSVQITAKWESQEQPGVDEPLWGIRVFVQNEATRPVQLQEVGLVYRSDKEVHRFAGALRQGIGQTVEDGQSGNVWFMAGGAPLEERWGPRTNVYVTVSGKDYYAPFPPEPSDEEKRHHSFRV